MHGAHHEAQMSTSTTLPLSDPRSILPPPSKRLTTTDGIGPPTLPLVRLCFLPGVSVSSRAASEEAHPPVTPPARAKAQVSQSDAKDAATISHWLLLQAQRGRTACFATPADRESRPRV